MGWCTVQEGVKHPRLVTTGVLNKSQNNGCSVLIVAQIYDSGVGVIRPVSGVKVGVKRQSKHGVGDGRHSMQGVAVASSRVMVGTATICAEAITSKAKITSKTVKRFMVELLLN